MPLGNPGVIALIERGSPSPIQQLQPGREQRRAEKRAEQNHGSYIEWLRTGEKDANWKRKSAEWETALLSERYLPKMLDMSEDDYRYGQYWEMLTSNLNRIRTGLGHAPTNFPRQLPTHDQIRGIYDKTGSLREKYGTGR